MASKALATIALLLSLNLLFLSMTNAHNQPKCQKDSLVLNACANVLGDLVKIRVGNPRSKCCSVIRGLVDLQVDACLCTVVNADVLGLLKVSAPIQLKVLLNYCHMKPRAYRCR
ncbi:hypothetical protein CRYUN_Cryun19dG0140600 [Craigia yunnanensis]